MVLYLSNIFSRLTFLSEMTEKEEVYREETPLGDCCHLSAMSPIGSESVSIQEHINVLEAHSQSYRSCASLLLCPSDPRKALGCCLQ